MKEEKMKNIKDFNLDELKEEFIKLGEKPFRAEQVFKGIVVLLLATELSSVFKLHTLYWILKNALSLGVIAVCIIFQPELRAGFEHLGRANFNLIGKNSDNEEIKKLEKTIDEIVETLYSLSRQRIGALIILERETKISDIISTGTIIDGDVSRQLLITKEMYYKSKDGDIYEYEA